MFLYGTVKSRGKGGLQVGLDPEAQRLLPGLGFSRSALLSSGSTSFLHRLSLGGGSWELQVYIFSQKPQQKESTLFLVVHSKSQTDSYLAHVAS